MKYLEVPEPLPAMVDFIPDDYSWMRDDPVAVLSDVRSRFESDWYQQPNREQARLAELEYARAEFARQLARERAEAARAEEERHQARLQLWTRYGGLDPRIARISSSEGQVQKQNEQIEKPC
jgi:hypothetical protein